jgi:hypothetical protein
MISRVLITFAGLPPPSPIIIDDVNAFALTTPDPLPRFPVLALGAPAGTVARSSLNVLGTVTALSTVTAQRSECS